MPKRITRDELEDLLMSLCGAVDWLYDDREQKQETIETHEATIARLEARLAYYENPNAPPSSDSLEWKRRKREKKKAAAKAREEGTAPPRKKPGGCWGHEGRSREHHPERTERHCFETRPECDDCMLAMSVAEKTRDVLHLIPARVEEIRHIIEMARCPKCGATREACHGLPRKGSYDKNIVGLIAELRAARVPLDAIPGLLHIAAGGLKISKAAVTGIMYRIGEALEAEKALILEEIKASRRANVDETVANLDGDNWWEFTIRSGHNAWFGCSESRGALMMDMYMDGFDGVVTSDMLRIYDRFDEGGRHQVCWAHELRNVKHAAERHGQDRGPPRRLYEDLCGIFTDAKKTRKRAGSSPNTRRAYEHSLRCIIQRYREGEDGEMKKLLNRLDRAHPRLFAFLEFDGVDPTNNAAEQALRYFVVFRKISGQIKGGARAAKSMSAFISCVQTWRNKGKSVAEEVGRLI